MKALQQFIASLSICAVLISMQFSIVRAGSAAQEAAYNPDAETYIREQLLVNGTVDLATAFPNEDARAVRADFIVSLWQDSTFETLPLFKLINVTVVGDLQGRGISIPYNVGFENCKFTGYIDLDSASTKTFRLDRCTVDGAVKMGRLKVDGDLALYQSAFNSKVTLFDAEISSNLFARGSRFLAPVTDADSKYPFELWKTQVGQSTEFSNALIAGEASAEDARFGVDVLFDGVTFEKAAIFNNIQVTELANFEGAVFKDSASFKNMQVGELADFRNVLFRDSANFESSLIERDIQFTEAVFEKDANLNYMAVERFLDFDHVTVKQGFSIQYPSIGWPYFAETQFGGPVNFEGMQTSNDFEFTNAVYEYDKEPFQIHLARVDGQVLLNGFISPVGLDLSHNVLGDLEITGDGNVTFDQINLESTVLNGDLTLDHINVKKLYAKELDVADKTTITRIRVSDEMDLSNASLGFFTMDDQGFWPHIRGQVIRFNLRGMTYNDIGLVAVKESEIDPLELTQAEIEDADGTLMTAKEFSDLELEDDTWGVLLNMVNQSEYSPQAYRTLAQFLTEKGHPEWAADVEFQRKNREREEILKPLSPQWFWSWFSCLFSGYGQIPALALIWSALVITIGAIFYWRESDLIYVDEEDAKPVYNPFLYSFALFAPFIDLDLGEKWEPRSERRVAWVYKYVLKLLGWILTPIALLTFGGILS